MRRYTSKIEATTIAKERAQRSGNDQAVVEKDGEFFVGNLNNWEIFYPNHEAWIYRYQY